MSWLESSSHPWFKKYSSIFSSNILELLCVFIFPSSCNLKSSLSTHGHQGNCMFIWWSSHKILESQGTSEVTQTPESLIVTLSFWERTKDFNLAYKILRIHPDFSLGFPRRKDANDFTYSLRTVEPKPNLFPLGLSSLISLYLTDSEFSWNFPCPCSNFVLIALGTLHSTCPLRPSLNASILHEVFLDFSSLPKHYSLLLRHGICYLGNSGVFVRYCYYLYNCLIPSLESTFVDSWCLARGRT